MSIQFDNLIETECVPGNPGGVDIDPSTCQETPPGPPTSDPQLIIKPEYAITETGKTVQYRTFLRADGDEVELTNGLTYTSSELEVAIIEQDGGLATGVTPGIVTIAVAWQDLNAQAQLEVVAECADIGNNFLLLIDNSFSSQVLFSGVYSSRLAFAKEAAIKFAQSVNYAKDKVAVAYFNEGGVVVLSLSSNPVTIVSAIQAITATSKKTNIYSGLQAGMNHLNLAAGHKVLILLSDGENNQGDDPELLSDPWKEASKLLIVVGLRAWGPYFDKLYRIASAGYFFSAYGDTQSTVINQLKGIKSFFCSGDCPIQSEPGTYPTAQLNYNGFENWDVFQGQVDLIGNGAFDVLPGNGLYVDLAGTRIEEQGILDVLGGLESKETFSIESGRDYRFSIDVAGNNVNAPNAQVVKVTIKSEDGATTFLNETITPTSNVMPFTTYEFEFNASATKDAVIRIEMIRTQEFGYGGELNVGPLIDNVIFEDITNSTVLLEDDFDDENETVIQPGYVYSYYGCLTEPPGEQIADPNPPPLAE